MTIGLPFRRAVIAIPFHSVEIREIVWKPKPEPIKKEGLLARKFNFSGPKSGKNRMAKPIVFSFKGSDVTLGMNKVDRSRLYGYKELEVIDDDGAPCELATLADDGRTLVGRGGTGIGYLDADGNWCEKENLRPVDLEGESITPVKSSFGAPIVLTDEVTIDDYMYYSVRLVYQMDLSNIPDNDALIQKIRDGAIFRFDYSYRGGLESDTGFLLANEASEIFMLVGDRTTIEFAGLQQAAPLVADDESKTDDDLMDFGMI